ncbi:MAG TPA: alkaline phosphatase family protein [Solirubrobacterales bacterium]
MSALMRPVHRALAAAATLTGKRFGLLVASSLVATSAIVASAATNPNGNGPLAALLSRSLAADNTPVAAAPAPQPASPPAPVAAESGSAPAPQPEAPAPSLAPAPAASEPKAQPEPETPAAPEVPAAEAGRIKHVFVLSLASPGYEAAFGAASQMPYLSTTLRPQGELLSGYSLLSGAGLPNAIATVGGQPPNPATKANCSTYSEFSDAEFNSRGVVSGSGCVFPVEALTLADQLGAGGFSWRAYMEGMADPETGKPDNCVHPESEGADLPPLGGYAARQNPFVYFHSLLDLGGCTTNDMPLTQLSTDLRTAKTTPNYSYIAPNLCNAGVAGQCVPGAVTGPAAADAFLAEWAPKITASPAYKEDGLLIVTFDELNPPEPGAVAPAPEAKPKVGALLLSRFVAPNSTDAGEYTPYSLLRSTDELFGLSPLAAAGGAKVKSFAPALLGENGGD